MRRVVVGSRGSVLALKQTESVVAGLRERRPDVEFVIRTVKTTGDNIRDVALAKIGDKGLFTKELEMALLNGEIDLAVHSMKDLPTRLPAGLVVAAVPAREEPCDVLVTRDGKKLAELPPGAVVGTSSLRRQAQLLAYRPDLVVQSIRGNLDTRLRKLDEGQVDGLVVAWAGLARLGYEGRVAERLPYDICLPAVGQGALGVEAREDDAEVCALLREIDDPRSRARVLAERAFLRSLEGGCQVPVGAVAHVQDRELVLQGMVATLDGRKVMRGLARGDMEEPEHIGASLAERLLDRGAREILACAREEWRQ
ncbi:MAG TPA: hydroxymethylbilane synthase [Peptococcaceae bacterium]|nr:hydroxymethylbilane synthase [Peptococcaceae bacterium]